MRPRLRGITSQLGIGRQLRDTGRPPSGGESGEGGDGRGNHNDCPGAVEPGQARRRAAAEHGYEGRHTQG